MTEDDRKVISNKIAKHGMDSLTDAEIEQMPFASIKFSFLELKKLVDVLNQAKTAPWLSSVCKVTFVTDMVRDLNRSMNEAVRKLSEYVKSREHYKDNFEKDNPPEESDLHPEENALSKVPTVMQQMRNEYPQTMVTFGEIQTDQYKLFAYKQADYGPGNIGMNGDLNLSLLALGVRMNDKVQRILHILNKQRDNRENVWETENEPLEDSFKDISVYGIIGQIVMEDKWGK